MVGVTSNKLIMSGIDSSNSQKLKSTNVSKKAIGKNIPLTKIYQNIVSSLMISLLVFYNYI